MAAGGIAVMDAGNGAGTDAATATLLRRISARAALGERRIAVAESLTGGALSAVLTRSPDAQAWFTGGVVAYQLAAKRRLLGVEAGIEPCSAACATQMAAGARELFAADVAAAVTGAGDPDGDDRHAPGTVYIAIATERGAYWWQHDLEGAPEAVLERSVEAALGHLLDVLHELPALHE